MTRWWPAWPWKRKPKVPNPGSQEAGRMGCVCPVNANNAGREKPKSGWLVRSICELHGEMETRHTKDGGMHTR